LLIDEDNKELYSLLMRFLILQKAMIA